MANEKNITGRDIDNLKRGVQTAVEKLEGALRQIGADQKYLNDCDLIYEYLNKIPTGKAFLENNMVEEDINIDAKAQDDTVRKAMEMGKKYQQDIKLNEDYLHGRYRYAVDMDVYIYVGEIDEDLAHMEALRLASDINKIGDGLQCAVKGVKFSKEVSRWPEERDPDSLKGFGEGVEKMTIKEFKERYMGGVIKEEMSVKDFKERFF